MSEDINPKQNTNIKEILEEMFDTPLISERIYQSLPKLLMDGIDLFPASSRERDMFFTASLVLISGSLPNCYFYYDNRKHYLNLFSMIVAPPASGKGVMIHANKYLSKIEEYLSDEYNTKINKYNEARKEDKSSDSKEVKKDGDSIDTKEKKPDVLRPRRKKLVIPANSSAASFLSILNDNNGSGIIFETEADTLALAFKQDWGNYSDTLRKAFHHEPVTFSRKMDDVIVDIKCPKLSVMISGTPGQVGAMGLNIPDNGLQSRFFFYVFNAIPTFKALGSSSNSNVEITLDKLSSTMKDTYLQLLNKPEGIEFILNQSQWNLITRFFKRKMEIVIRKYNALGAAIVTRGSLVAVRIAGILALLDEADNLPLINTTIITCSNQHLIKAIRIVDTYIDHTLVIYHFSKFGSDPDAEMHKYMDFYKLLPECEFTRQDVLGIAKKIGFSERTIDRRLEKLRKSGRLESIKAGTYKKK